MEASNLIDDAFLGHDINLRQRTSVKMRMLAIMNHLEPTFLVIKIMGICTILLGLIGLLLVLNLTLQERTREFGIMKSLGASVKKISILIRQEFLYITLLASIAGMIFTLPMTNALTKLIAETIIRHPVNFQYDTFQIFISIALVLGLQTLLISIYGHFKIRQNARELLDHNF
jgi:putative ABC transport system permease protein